MSANPFIEAKARSYRDRAAPCLLCTELPKDLLVQIAEARKTGIGYRIVQGTLVKLGYEDSIFTPSKVERHLRHAG